MPSDCKVVRLRSCAFCRPRRVKVDEVFESKALLQIGERAVVPGAGKICLRAGKGKAVSRRYEMLAILLSLYIYIYQ